MRPQISLCHATAREGQSIECLEGWRDSSSGEVEIQHVVAFGSREWRLFDAATYLRDGGENRDHYQVEAVIGEPSTAVGGWNRAAAHALGGILVQVSDDMRPEQDWDKKLVELAPDPTIPMVLGCSPATPATGNKPGLLTLAIMTRAYMQQKGYFICPAYHGVFEDDDLTQAAAFDGVLQDTYHLLHFEHRWGGHEGDEVYRRQNSARGWLQGHLVYQTRLHDGFPALRDMGPLGVRQMPQVNDMSTQLRILFTDPYMENVHFEDQEDPRYWFQVGNFRKAAEMLEQRIAEVERFNGGQFLFEGGRHMLARARGQL